MISRTSREGIPSPITLRIKVSFDHSGIGQSNGNDITISSSYIVNTLASEYKISPEAFLYVLPG